MTTTPDIDDDTALRFSLLELGDAPPVSGPEPEAPVEPAKPTLRPAPRGVEKHDPIHCGIQVHVMMHTPRVVCGQCGEELDPLEVLRLYAKQERRFEYMNEDARSQLQKLRREIEALKRERHNLDSQVRRRRR